MAKKRQPTTLTPDAICALRASSFSGNSFSLPDGHLDCYPEIKAVVTALGGQWSSAAKKMIFPVGIDCASLVLSVCERGVLPPTNPLDYYPTPSEIVEKIVSHPWLVDRWDSLISRADDRPIRYLEPNGGSGALAAVLAHRLRPQDELVICELNPLLVEILQRRFPTATIREGDFLTYDDPQKFDFALMNPPFAGETYRKHVDHAYGLLRQFGFLASIVPTSFRLHSVDFCYRVGTRGESIDFGRDRFANTSYETSAVFMQNDPACDWKDRPSNGCSTHHAWEAALSINNCGDTLARLQTARDFEDAVHFLRGWSDRMIRNDCMIRMNEGIARETLGTLVHDYDHKELSHLIPPTESDDAEPHRAPRQVTVNVPAMPAQGELAFA